MKLMQFDNSQKIGLKVVDDQHKEIIETVNHLYDIKDSAKQEILGSFSSLLSQLKTHFETEENLMKESKMVHYISHKLEHDRAFLKYSDYSKSFETGRKKFDSEIILSFKNWFECHLMKKDFRLRELSGNN